MSSVQHKAVSLQMWREEVGMMEMLLSYIGDFNDFDCWSNWRSILVDILSTHEDIRRLRTETSHKFERNNLNEECSMLREDDINEDSTAMCPIPTFPANSFEYGSYIECDDQHATDVEEYKTTNSRQCPDASSAEDEQCLSLVHESQTSNSRFIDGSTHNTPQDNFQTEDDTVNQFTFKEEVRDSVEVTRIPNHLVSDSGREVGALKRCHSRRDASHACQVCGKKLSKAKLIVHMRSHTGERPFKCLVCGKSFTQNCNLKKHSLIHTGERPHSCHICGKSFTQHMNLLRHQKIHAREGLLP